jgi:hypothetical protein
MKALVTLLLLFGTAVITEAQTRQVSVEGETPEADRVVSALKAKLGGTLRYKLTDNITAELLVTVQCVGVGPALQGFVCDATFLYYLPMMKGMNVWLGASLATAADAQAVADRMFEGFVDYTSDEKLAAVNKAYKTVCPGVAGAVK